MYRAIDFEHLTIDQFLDQEGELDYANQQIKVNMVAVVQNDQRVQQEASCVDVTLAQSGTPRSNYNDSVAEADKIAEREIGKDHLKNIRYRIMTNR